MTVTVIRNNINGTTSSAPNLTGQVGSLIGVLDFCLVTTMGWTKDYTGTNLASYRQPTGTSNRMYLGVNDTNATVSRVRGFESMTAAGVAVASGSGPFPTDAQVSGGDYLAKSSTADTTARPWLFVSNGRCFYLFTLHNGTGNTGDGMFFGDFKSYKSADAYNVALIANPANGATAFCTADYILTNGAAKTYIARSYTQTGGSVNSGRHGDCTRNNQTGTFGSTGQTYPSPVEGGLLMGKIYLGEGTVAIGFRGEFPGLYYPMHNRPLAAGDTFSGTGALSGKTFEVVNPSSSGQIFIETSDTWGSY